jgi:glycosyltransferase involved in cell wall biosynthesis
MLASIIINNYNYGRFLTEAIDSALGQTYQNIEVIVVDDGSTDSSREVIVGYDDRVISVFKTNGGQASAMNAGFEKSNGDVIIFLDSDDILFTDAVQKVMPFFVEESVAKVHWPLYVMNEQGIKTGEIKPKSKLPEGDFRNDVLHIGPPFSSSPPTSGNGWSRKFIESVMPIPENKFRIGADTYLFEIAPFFGMIKRIEEPQGFYRSHRNNNYGTMSFSDKLTTEVRLYDALFTSLEKYCKKLGIPHDSKVWRKKSWFHLLQEAVLEIKELAPESSNIILVDDNKWDAGNSLEGRRIHPFPEEDGYYAGAPANDAEAIAELERLRKMGADYIVFGWGCFWWLDHYKDFKTYLEKNYKCVKENERLILFQLNHIS